MGNALVSTKLKRVEKVYTHVQGVGHVFLGKCFKYFLFVLFDLIRSWCFTGKLYKTIRDMLFEEIKPKILFLKNAFPE